MGKRTAEIALRQARTIFVRKKLGEGAICDRCGATLETMGDKCSAPLEEPCPGFVAIDEAVNEFDARLVR